jgi:hypothetical protein
MNVRDIIIVGGGSSGWMTAASLIKEFPNKKITLIESPNTPTVGVGESTIGGIRNWTKWLGVDDKQFLKFTDGSYKLSIKFTDFCKKGEEFHYPFGSPILDGNLFKLNDWWFKKMLYPETPYSDYADCNFSQMALVNSNKLLYNKDKKIPFNFLKDTAFHFDATKFGIWLKDFFCIPKNVKHIKEEIVSIEQDENGIKSLNNKYSADLYIDCTGFKSLLLDKTLKESFESYSDMLPNNSAWATRIPYVDKEKELVSYTNCTAIENGWVWNIPLWSRIGTGYVYSDKFISDEDALIQFKEYLMRSNPIKLVPCNDLEFKKIKMRVGIHKRLFVKNVVAIGLSAGFIEPLESNGLFTVHEFLTRLIRNLQRENITQWDRDNFNYDCKILFKNFAEFVALHYALSQRNDTEYWRSHNNKNWEDKIYDLSPTGINGIFQAMKNRTHFYEHSKDDGIHCIAAGMHWSPTDLHSILYSNQLTKKQCMEIYKPCILQLNKRKKIWVNSVKDELSLFEFLKKNIYN